MAAGNRWRGGPSFSPGRGKNWRMTAPAMFSPMHIRAVRRLLGRRALSVRAVVLPLLLALACGGSASNTAGPVAGGNSMPLPIGLLSDGGTSGDPDGGSPAEDGGVDGGPQDPPGTGVLPLRHSPIVDENLQPGGSGWRLDSPTRQLAAYADRTSALPGEQVIVRAGASVATSVTWELWRLGYYGGPGGRRFAPGRPAPVSALAHPVDEPATRP